ncbi:MAG: sulfotransferase [Acidimicrobiales bacterium]
MRPESVAAGAVGSTGFDADALVEAASTATGLSDLGEPTWSEGLDRLLDDLAGPARLNDLGRTIVETEVATYLGNRMAILAWRATHPDVAGGAITRPVVIVGQPRTGTTILYDLMAQDPANRAPLTWEVDRPCPPPETSTFDSDPRIDEAEAIAAMPDLIIPGFTDFHPLGARLAQECVRMTAGDFRSMIFPTQYDVPEYDRWLLHDADMAPAYRWHRIYLQHLQSRHAGERWLLKSPAHLWSLAALMAEYPDAVVVQTHRDPVRVIASISALVALLRSMSSDHATVPRAAEQYADDIVVGLDRSVEARRDGTVPADQVVDVQFHEFMADPLAAIGTIYDAMGITLTADAETRMRAFLATHPGDGGGGGSRYSFSDTGLDAGELRSRSRDYQEYFDVPDEPVV